MPSDEQDKAGVVAPPPLIYLVHDQATFSVMDRCS